ncbi:MAG: glycosyltransferase family 2 protein [Planctomycetes bacterium]|nr:glycosyltransferase family 2 protein [Planctomycetota bacterium]MCK5472991.1 glycosyltransferase family 2 protein [Planctomycetota bacterium]
MNTSTNQPLVSVGIPTYNRPDGLRQTLKCVTSQNYKNLEIIVSDNCSPGRETQDVVREFADKDARVKYYRQEKNEGAAFNFKFVLEKATGEYFAWIADDDEWKESYIEKCLEKLTNNTVLCYSEAIVTDPNTMSTFLWKSDMETLGLDRIQGLKKILVNQHRNTEYYGLMRTNIAKKYIFKNTFGEDHVFVFYMALNGEIAKTEQGLFVSGVNLRNTEKMVEDLYLPKNNLYFGFIHQMINMVKVVFKYNYNLGLTERLIIIFWIIRRYFTRRFRRPIKRGFKLYLSNIFRGKL